MREGTIQLVPAEEMQADNDNGAHRFATGLLPYGLSRLWRLIASRCNPLRGSR